MIKSLVEILDSYASAYRELVNEKNWSSDKGVTESLRLNKDEDWAFICTAMDIVSDASLAIDNFLKFGLDGPTKYDENGEKYLRLYGVLNATYIQQQAVHNLYKLNNVPNPKKIKQRIENLKIREVRHKLGAHSNDYINYSNQKKIESYVPVRMMLSGHYCEYMNNETIETERIDLKEYIEEHLRLLTEIIDKIYEKAISTFYKGHSKKIKEHMERLNDLRVIRSGGIVIKPSADAPKLIITFTSTET